MMQTAIAALGEPNRFQIVELLRAGPRSVNEIAGKLKLAQPAVSKHLRVLKESGWVDVQPKAQERHYELQPGPLRELRDWVERYRDIWESRFDAMDGVIEDIKTKEATHGRSKRSKK